MSLFDKKTTVVLYIQPHSLDFIFLKSGQILHLDFPTTIVNHLEVIDQIALEQLIATFVTDNKLKKQTAIILISSNSVFEKKISKSDPKQTELIDSFLEKVPLPPAELAKKIISTPEESIVLAMNNSLFESIARIVKKYDWTAETVVPFQAFPELTGENQFNPENIRKYITDNDRLNTYNILTSEEEKPAVESKSASHRGSMIMVTSSVLLIVGAIGLGIIFFKPSFPKPNMTEIQKYFLTQTKDVPKVLITVSPIDKPTTIPVPTVTFDKTEYKVTVLNGSGKAGEASLVQDQLTAAGFEIERIANADRSDYELTEISAQESVSKEFLKELEKEISSSYKMSSTEAELTEDSEDEVVVIIGQTVQE